VRARIAPETPVYVLSNALPMWAFYTTPPTGRARHGPLPLARAARWSCRPGVSQRAGPPGRLRADEAATLVGRWRARPIVGLATGLRKRDLAGLARSRPDSGWVEGEVARIVAAGDHDECIGTGCASGN